jgi:MHS family shikimate/dehydroshikimate transporter-like MFS transporter
MRATQIAAALAAGASDGVMFGPHAACFAELFGPSLRYSGFAFARELGSIVSAVRLPLFPHGWFDGSVSFAPVSRAMTL